MAFNALKEKGLPLEKQLRNWHLIVREPYNKNEVDCYSRTRQILMNGIEIEAWNFKHAFSRFCPDSDDCKLVAMTRRIEDQQQTTINWLAPKDQSVLETTLGYEQVAVDLTAWMAQNEPDSYVKETMDSNDIIIRNMIKGFEFISKKPEFNKQNLITLYNLLSKDSLTEQTKLDGEYYRLDKVYVDDHEGCPANKIEDYMNSLYKYVNEEINNRNFYLPFIAHYYMIYIHPYYDYNGRTARMVSLWISLLADMNELLPAFISEAINDDKNNSFYISFNT